MALLAVVGAVTSMVTATLLQDCFDRVNDHLPGDGLGLFVPKSQQKKREEPRRASIIQDVTRTYPGIVSSVDDVAVSSRELCLVAVGGTRVDRG